MDVIKIEAKKRTPGKGAARAARRAQEVPCTLYGHGVEPVNFQVPELDLRPLIYTHETHRVELSVEGGSWDCILKSIVMHPLTDRPFHADFQVLKRGEAITLSVPVQVHGQAKGVREGGDLQVVLHELEVRCLPKDIPGYIDVDVTALGIGDAIHLRDLQLPEGVVPTLPEEQTVVLVAAPRRAEEVAPETEAPAPATDISDEDEEA